VQFENLHKKLQKTDKILSRNKSTIRETYLTFVGKQTKYNLKLKINEAGTIQNGPGSFVTMRFRVYLGVTAHYNGALEV
jgi:hypothetical protein